MITNPDNLSKDRLKAELKKKGIRFNHNENKSYYVDLYRSKVLSVEPGFKGGKGEFSSDDEIRQSPRVSKKQPSTTARRRSGKPDPLLTDIQKLSDSELKAELQQHGENPGPITNVTRSTYQRHLAKLVEEDREYVKESPKKRTATHVKEVIEESFVGEWSDEGDDENFMGEAENGNEQTDDGYLQEQQAVSYKGRSYNLRSRHSEHTQTEPPQKPAVSRPHAHPAPPRPQPHSPTPPREEPTSSPAATAARRRGSKQAADSTESCRILWSLFLLVATFVVVFLLYEHFTVPDGKTSLLVSGYETANDMLVAGYGTSRDFIVRLVTPLMASQKVEPGAESETAEKEEKEEKPSDSPPKKEEKQTTKPAAAKPAATKKPKETTSAKAKKPTKKG